MKGTYAYMGEDSELKTTEAPSNAMNMLDGKSSFTTATNMPIPEAARLSVKVHNAVHHHARDYHGPPQMGSTGVMMSSDILKTLQPLRGYPGIAGEAGAGKKGLFGNLNRLTEGTSAASKTLPEEEIMN
ncbi:hypothetical protein GP486_005637 [Trichoglossum hirsutum]|uniref:Uncharacterized protein n=1 Tax=Trichoglossum hirsutum TaxID=265104 RepID=A0A9P8RLV9_9PEZI|nr:hypothetical protein GP486_005637 [Trichoglossum hirsutum]